MGRSRILPTIYLVTAISKISSIIYTLNLPFFPGCNYGFAFLFYNRNLCHRIPRIFFLKIEIPRISRFFELIHSQFDEFKSNPSPLSNSNNKLNKVVFICAASLKFDLANVIQQTIKIKTWPPTPCGFVCQGLNPCHPMLDLILGDARKFRCPDVVFFLCAMPIFFLSPCSNWSRQIGRAHV